MRYGQLTIRKVPDQVNTVLRERAAAENESINQAAVDALTRGLGLSDVEAIHHDLDDLAGTIPFVVLAELRAGFASGTHGPANEKVLTLFLNRARVSTLFADEATTMIYARLFFQLRKQGTPIPVHDIWIAALAAQHDLVIFTRDAQFEALPQIPRI